MFRFVKNFSFIIPHHDHKTLKYINEVLDGKVLRDEVKLLDINLKSITSHIIQWMSEFCTQFRSDAINELFHINDVTITFRRIIELMEVMKSDKGVVYLDAIRKEIHPFAVEYEKQKLTDMLRNGRGKIYK